LATNFQIAVFAGDGIGVEIMDACLAVLEVLQAKIGGFRLVLERLPGGAAAYRDTGIALSEASFRRAEAADAILFGAMGLPEVRYPDGTEIAPHLAMRREFALVAGIRPAKVYPHARLPLADPRAKAIDLVILRESTEGLFASVGKGVVEADQVARDTLVISRATSEQLFDVAFALAARRQARGGQGRVTCVDKANVFASMAFFRKVFDERAAAHPSIRADHAYVDAMALDLVRRPWAFDVLVMENMFGDILSDLAAGLVGGMGMAPCAEVGARHGLFQPAHGSAPDIMGRDLANPVAMLLSAALMLDWLGERHGVPACQAAAERLEATIEAGFRTRAIWPIEQGGSQGTKAVAHAVGALL
jgi:3-isopropylmalate dehydrogenase